METKQPQTAVAKYTGRASLVCKFLPPTSRILEKRISVQRFQGSTHGKDPNKMTLRWDYALGIEENYTRAVQEYLTRADWRGLWVVSITNDGAVAVFSGALEND